MKPITLYAVLLGGRADGCHIELHDVVFVATHSLEEAYPNLRRKWFGAERGLHIDSSAALQIVENYEISLSRTPPVESENQKSLYFTNFGGYQEGHFGELHEIGFFVAESKSEVVNRAKQKLCLNALQQHCDNNFIIGSSNLENKIDDIIKIAKVDDYYIHLTPTSKSENISIESSYRRIDRKQMHG